MSSRCRASVALLLAIACANALADELKVCAEPNNLPYSDRNGRGFENHIATVLAKDLHASLKMVPIAQDGPGFLRATLGRGRCDAILAMPSPNDHVALTRPYYRSSWYFVTRADRRLDVASFDDPRLADLRIGVPVVGEGADTPPLIALGRRGLVRHLARYSIGGDLGDDEDATARMIDDVATGRIDLAIAWGPAAGYHAARHGDALHLAATPASDFGIPFQIDIAIAVKKGNVALRDKLDAALEHRRSEIGAILAQYHVPMNDALAVR